MATTTTTKMITVEEFMALPTDQSWEVWEGELREVPSAGVDASALAAWIGALISLFVRPRNLGVVTGADGTFILRHDPLVIVVPDVAFTRWERFPGGVPPKGYSPIPPDLAIEVRSPSDRDRDIAEKLLRYRRAGVPLVWWVDPRTRTVAVYRNGEIAVEHDMDGVLDGEDVLPGFTLPINDIFS